MNSKITQLETELAQLTKAEAEIKSQIFAAQAELSRCQDETAGTGGGLNALQSAQSTVDALAGALRRSAEKITAKRFEIDDATKSAQREADLEALAERQRAYTVRLKTASERLTKIVDDLNRLDEVEKSFAELGLEFLKITDEADRLDERVSGDNAVGRRNYLVNEIKLMPIREGLRSTLQMHWQQRASAPMPIQKAA